MKFTNSRVAFGRHETFALRYGWLTKGVQELNKATPLFEAEDATVRLGVGKNMVSSIRYWLQAAQIIRPSDEGWQLTDVGETVFGDKGYDPYLEDDATIWLLHWLLATNPELATTWWWFFNRYHKPEFTSTEVATALQDFSEAEIKGRHAANTLKKDAAVLLRMYVRSADNKRIPVEEALDSPLSILGLIARVPGGNILESRPGPRPDLPPGVLGYAIVDLMNELGETQIPIEELMYGRPDYPAIGAVFRLTESSLLAKIEQLADELPTLLTLRETAGIHQLYLLQDEVMPTEFLDYQYDEIFEEIAA